MNLELCVVIETSVWLSTSYPEPSANLVSIYIIYYIVQSVSSEKYFCADKYIISYCKPQLTGSCKISYCKNFMSDAVSCNVGVLHAIVMWCLTQQAILQGQLFICTLWCICMSVAVC